MYNKLESLETGLSKVEYGIYENNKLIRIFRTDVSDMEKVIENEAIKHSNFLKKENSENNYHIKKITALKTTNPG